MQNKSLQEIFDDIDSFDISNNKKSKYRWAIKKFSIYCGQSPEYVPCHAGGIRACAGNWQKPRLDMSEASFQEMKKLLQQLVRLYQGKHRSPRRFDDIKSGDTAWAPITQQIAGKWQRAKIAAFVIWCVDNNICPDAVTDAVAERYLAEAAEGLLSEEKIKSQRDCLRKGWNNLARNMDDWPGTILILGKKGKWQGLSKDQFPASFRNEVERYIAFKGINPDFVMDEGARIVDMPHYTRVHPVSRKLKVVKPQANSTTYTRSSDLWDLARNCGLPPEQVTSIAALCQTQNLKAWVRHFQRKCKQNDTGELTEENYRTLLAKMQNLSSVSLNWCDQPDFAFIELCNSIAKPVKQQLPDMSRQKKIALEPFRDPRIFTRVLGFPQAFFEKHKNKRHIDHVFALEVQGVIIAMMLMALPQRRGAVQQLTLRDGVVRDAHGFSVNYLSHTTKTKMAQSSHLSGWRCDFMQFYLEKCRPLLRNAEASDALFPGHGPGGRKNVNALAATLNKVVFRHTGLKLNMHHWRSVMALFIIHNDPVNGVERARRLLSHSPHSNTINHYVEIVSTWESSALQGLLDEEIAAWDEYVTLAECNSDE